jgi:hypothetical protein
MIRLLKVLAVALALFFAQETGAKEYSYRTCDNLETMVSDCKKCKEIGVAQIKENKQIRSIAILLPGTAPVVFNQCQIFDDETFVCNEKIFEETTATYKSASLANGIFTSDVSLLIRDGGFYESFDCAIEKKGLLNFFK